MEKPFVPCISGENQIDLPTSSNLGFFYLRLLSRGTDEGQRLICLRSDRLYTVGRKRKHCEIVFDHCCISRRHCQLFLDRKDQRLKLFHGFFLSLAPDLGEVRRRFECERQELGFGVSLNGVSINGRKLKRGTIAMLSEGDEVALGCSSRRSGPGCTIRCGFIVEDIFVSEFAGIPDVSGHSVTRADLLLKLCRRVLSTGDPIKYLSSSPDLNLLKRSSFHRSGSAERSLIPVHESCFKPDTGAGIFAYKAKQEINLTVDNDKDANTGTCSQISAKVRGDCNHIPHQQNPRIFRCCSNAKTFFLNRLELTAHGKADQLSEVTLVELLHPVESLVQIFIATFTCDIAWFLSHCQIPSSLPVTVACHNAEKCWSSSCYDRASAPYSDYPNLWLVYPSFPDEIAFGKDRSKKGVACHHPKLFLLQRDESVRVVVTSANLVSKQWNQITNTVWWQDFPRRNDPNYSSLFATIKGPNSDFAAQLAGFIASLISGVPSQAHWINDLARHDFGGASAHLIASIPGIHASCTDSSLEQILFLKSSTTKNLGTIQASVVGFSHRFRTTTDPSGKQLKNMVSFFGKCQESSSGLLEVALKRNYNIPADANAISVHVANFNEPSTEDSLQLGFLPRDVAKWAAPLVDLGLFEFSAFICCKEAISTALDEKIKKLRCLLLLTQGPYFSEMSRLIQPKHFPALCLCIASIQRCVGLWRLQELPSSRRNGCMMSLAEKVISQYKWPESLETNFVYATSSLGTSMNPQFLAEFAAAAGKKSFQSSESEESDPDWGCWSIDHELRCPSVRILFPTIDRVKTSIHGVQSSRFLLSFAEKTWQSLSNTGIFHDAVPNPAHRIGYPMHVKVACRRFLSQRSSSSFGWIYCGSHNFSPAAWGRLTLPSPENGGLRPRSVAFSASATLRICNYELGVLLIVPPPEASEETDGVMCNLDDIALPFVMPAPRYRVGDRPATTRAMREAMAELAISEDPFLAEQHEEEVDEMDDPQEVTGAALEYGAEENEEDKIYAEMLWSQVDSSDSF